MIPNTAHFLWLGDELPWANALSVYSATRRGGFERIVLHHDQEPTGSPGWSLIHACKDVELRLLNPARALGDLGQLGRALAELVDRLEQGAARSNVLRVAILAREGGVYLDMDTITLAPFGSLLWTGVFAGTEHIVLTPEVARSRHPGEMLSAGLRIAMRDLYRRLPRGYLAFQDIAHGYPLAVNNAVLGMQKGHPFAHDLLRAMVEMARPQQVRRYALGPHLLEAIIERYEGDDLSVHGPERFSPLPPEISEHWFRNNPAPDLTEVLSPLTVLAHWYESVRNAEIVPRIDRAFVQKNAHRQLFSALAALILGEEPNPADRQCDRVPAESSMKGLDAPWPPNLLPRCHPGDDFSPSFDPIVSTGHWTLPIAR